MPVQHLRHHRPAAARPDDVDHHLLVPEHPVPVRPAVDPHRGLVGADHPGTPQAGEDGGGLVVEPRLGAPEQRVQGTLADRQREQVQEQPGQPPVADGVGETQVERQRQDRDAERGALVHPLRDRRQGGPAAARAAAEVALDPGDHRAHRRQLDLVVAGVQDLGGIVERRPAVGARGGLGDHELVGLLGQRSATARPAQAAPARPGAPLPLRPVRLVALGRRQAGVARRLRRLVQPRLQFRHRPSACPAHSARISASFSASVSRLRSGGGVIPP